MIESRCGILCGQCKYYLKGECKGCTRISKPFWGEACPVKSCCEDKSLEHCGVCDSFPCKQLHDFSYDEQEGDQGARLKQCKAWINGAE